MPAVYLLLFFGLSLFAEDKAPKIQIMDSPKTLEDYEHQFKGCPENSECDQVLGHQMQQWKTLIEKLDDDTITKTRRAQLLELFREKYGLPVEFYTTKKSQETKWKPLYYNSPCKEHNPKNAEDKRLLKGTAFIKGLSAEKALIWRDQVQFEVPLGEMLIPQPVRVYNGDQAVTYQLPLGDQPLLIRNKNLLVLKEEDGFFYFLRISPDGKWKVEDIDFSRLSEWETKREPTTCPVDKVKANPAFGQEFCKLVWDEDQKKTVIVKMHQGCPI